MRPAVLSALLITSICAGCQPSANGPVVRYQPVSADCPAAPDPAASIGQPPPASIPGAGRPVKLAKPEFPICAENLRVPGFVDLIFTIEPDGSVGDLQVVQETPTGFGFAKAALDVFPAWKFQPKLVEGKPVATRVTYRMSWRLA